MPNELIAMRLKDMWTKHPDQDNSHVCSQCGEKVGIYPSGQIVLKTLADVKITCNECADFDDGTMPKPAPGAIQEAIESIRRRKKQ